MTKREMSEVIVEALYNDENIAERAFENLVEGYMTMKKNDLFVLYQLAVKAK